MTKRICALFISVLILVSLIPVASMAQEGKTEIEFCVGDATLIINGEEVTVETPYVVGEGVTLVPLRVITEAFGANVEWVAETKTIFIAEGNMYIILQINNPKAWVNGEEKVLLSPPELTSNGFTMVPLRFISESFGALVSYDEETKKISVIKEAEAEIEPENWTLSAGTCMSDVYNFKISVPEDYKLVQKSENEIVLESSAENDFSFVGIGIYSKDKVTSPAVLARQIISENKNKYKSGAVESDTDITKTTINGYAGCEYDSKINAADVKGSYRNIFFELGEYVYNLCIFDDKAGLNPDTYSDNIIKSMSLKEMDYSLIGSLGRFIPEEKPSFSCDSLVRCTFTMPGEFSEIEEEALILKTKDETRSDKKLIFSDGKIVFEARRILFKFEKEFLQPYDPEGFVTLEDFRRIFSYYGGLRTDSNTEIIQSAKDFKVGKNHLLKLVLMEEGYGYIRYHDIYIGELNDALYIFSATYPEIYYSNDNRDIIQSIITSIEFRKD